jgi:hypothetical protein
MTEITRRSKLVMSSVDGTENSSGRQCPLGSRRPTMSYEQTELARWQGVLAVAPLPGFGDGDQLDSHGAMGTSSLRYYCAQGTRPVMRGRGLGELGTWIR